MTILGGKEETSHPKGLPAAWVRHWNAGELDTQEDPSAHDLTRCANV